MIIRRERPEEFVLIYELVKVAFQTARFSDGQEQDFVNALRGGDSYIPELDLVAEENGTLIGQIMLTKTEIVDGGNRFETLLLAPSSVALEYRNRGVGSSLIQESFKLAREMGYSSVILVGDPAYYRRFGFKATLDFGIKPKLDIPDENVMVCELVPGTLDGISGTAECC